MILAAVSRIVVSEATKSFTITVVERDVVVGYRAGVETDMLADGVRRGFGFGLTHDLGGGAVGTVVQHFVGALMCQDAEFLPRRKTHSNADATATAGSQSGANVIRVLQHDSLRREKRFQPGHVDAGLARGLPDIREWLAVCLTDIEDRNLAETNLDHTLRALALFWFLVFTAERHRCKDRDALLALLDLAPERLPGLITCHARRRGTLPGDEKLVAETVLVELRDRLQVRLDGYGASLAAPLLPTS